MADVNKSSKTPLIALLVSFPLVCALVGFAFLPRPVTTAVARSQTDRTSLEGTVSKDVFPMQNALNIEFERLTIRGANLPKGTVKVGQEFALDVFFEATGEMNRNWQIFLHIDRQGKTHRIHGDHFPASNRYPTTLWQKGEHIKDHWVGEVPSGTPPGTYEVWLGLYIGDERMKYRRGKTKGNGKENRVMVGSFEIHSK